ncbi:MAG: hypothetical protein ACR2JO_00935 [Mycobacteriales bacterium]
MTTSQDWWPADFGHYGGFFALRPRSAGCDMVGVLPWQHPASLRRDDDAR